MTQQQRSELDKALARADRRGIYILAHGRRRADGGQVWLTNSGSHADGTHFVTLADNRLTCDCPATVICVHRAVVYRRLVEERQRATAVAPVAPAKTGPACAAPARSNAPFSLWK